MLTLIFAAIQLLSFAVMILFVHEYKRIAHKHEDLTHTIEAGVKPCCALQSTIIIWIYVSVMSTILIGSTIIFLMQPSLL